MERWYVVCCKPRQETVAEDNLRRQDFQVYLPRIRITRRRLGKWLDVVEPLFPRYIFIRIDPNQRSIAPIRSTRGVFGLIRFGGQPAVVPDEIVDALLRREDPDAGLHRDGRPLFSVGEAVKLVDGPLAGMEGIFNQEDGEQRVIVLLDLLGKTHKTSVNRDWVAPAA